MRGHTVRVAGIVACALALLSVAFANAAPVAGPVDVLTIDFNKRIDESARYRERFAIDVPHAANAAEQGEWTRGAGESVWRYSVRVPTAVSMSFHANPVTLPASATLTLSGGGSTFVIDRRALNTSDYWSRIVRGDTLAIEIRVAAIEESRVAFRLASVQAGYRGLGGGVADHPHYKQLQAQATASSCIENYQCHETAANRGPGQATAAIVIGGISLCTATLINNVREDGTPFLLTARHCQNGVAGGGAPEMASSVTVYWDAATPCGGALGTFYDTNVPAYSGGGSTTVLEQQDVWLIQLGFDSAAAQVYFAGWDATGGTWSGGYSPHHAGGRSRQYTGWFGQALLNQLPGSALDVNYDSTFWGVVNSVGSIGTGASGGGLFDAHDRLVGTASLGYLQPGTDGDGVCPTSPPHAPTSNNLAAEYNALSAVWDSTADTTSTTNPATLRSVLDPDNTGRLVVDGFALLPGTFLSPSTTYDFTGQSLTLTWNAPGATSCTATGGLAGDGWSGSLPTSGSKDIIEYDGGTVIYRLRCTGGSRVGIAKARVEWQLSSAQVYFGPDESGPFYIGESRHLVWGSNVTPCTASGGPGGAGWAGPKPTHGSQDIAFSQLGPVTYSISCGTGSRTATADYTFEVWPPYASLETGPDNMRIGQQVYLLWGGAPNCVASGGAPGDGWGGALAQPTVRSVTETTPGTYTYTVTCSGGGLSANASVTRTFTGDPPTATLSADPTSLETIQNGAPAAGNNPFGAALSWAANVAPCKLTFTGPGSIHGYVSSGDLIGSGILYDGESVAGDYVYTLSCGTAPNVATASTTVHWFTTHPTLTLAVGPDPLVGNQAAYVGWNSNVLPCTASGGTPGDGWAGPKTDAVSSQAVVETTPGDILFAIDCGTGATAVHAQATGHLPPPAVTLTAGIPSAFVNDTIMLDWVASTSPCTPSGNGSSPYWTGPFEASGTRFVSESTPGTYTYSIACGPAAAQVHASVDITFNARPIPPAATASIQASATTVNINEPVTITWSSANAGYCLATGTGAGDGWTGLLPESGTATLSKSTPGTYTYQVLCSSANAQVDVQYLAVDGGGNPFPSPTVNLSANAASRVVGQSLMLSWTSANAAACTASGGANGDGWGGSLSLTGSQSVTESVAGAYMYTITCDGAPPSAQSNVSATFTAAAPPPNNGGGGGGGGGSIDPALLALLASLMAWRGAALARGGNRTG